MIYWIGQSGRGCPFVWRFRGRVARGVDRPSAGPLNGDNFRGVGQAAFNPFIQSFNQVHPNSKRSLFSSFFFVESRKEVFLHRRWFFIFKAITFDRVHADFQPLSLYRYRYESIQPCPSSDRSASGCPSSSTSSR